MRLCDKQLARWYRDFNARWFSGSLPDDTDVLYAPEEGCSAIANTDEAESFFIKINPAYAVDTNIVKLMLIHEMCHIALWPHKSHGVKFQAEMQRLALAGAFKGLW